MANLKFLIWSDYHNAWHRRSVDEKGEEHATGYTHDIADAGFFSEKTAAAYDDSHLPADHRRDRKVSLSDPDIAKKLAAERERLERQLDNLNSILTGG